MWFKIKHFFSEYRELGLVLLALVMGLAFDLSGWDVAAHWVLGAAAAMAVGPLLWGMIQDLRSGQYGVDILAATAIVTSVALKEFWAGMVIVLMLTGGEALEDYAEKRAKTELDALLSHAPKKAHLLKGRKVSQILVSQIQTGDKLVVKPGELIPVDAVIIDGQASIDESSLTGESLPTDKQVGDELLSGSVNLDSVLTIKALRPAAESQYEQIIQLVKSASASQSPFVRLADRYSVPFTAVSFIIAGAVWAVSGDAKRFLEVLVVATPCPLLLGAPIALISGMSRSAKHGIIFKTGAALERLAAVRTVAFDKTGTLTMGTPFVDNIKTFGSHTTKAVLQAAAALEQQSNHVLARSIVEAARAQNLKLPKVQRGKETAGYGLSGRVKGQEILVGKAGLLEEAGVKLPTKTATAKTTIVYVAIDGQLAGHISFTDVVRPESKATIQRLKRAGLRHILMVTGDNQASAHTIAKQLGITDVQSNCLPADKLRVIEEVSHRPIAFVGDGVNDAPVLTASDVGVALGARGSAAASQSADVVIMLDDLGRVASAVEIAKRTLFIGKQSILIGIFISLGLMLVFATGRFKPVQGALLQEVVDVTVIINALRAHGTWRRNPSSNS